MWLISLGVGLFVGLLYWVLNLYRTREDITRDDTGELYLRRFFLIRGGKSRPRLLLHKFYRGDEDLHLHDHPWAFTSLILTRGYWEETPCDVIEATPISYIHSIAGEYRRRIFYRRFSLLRRPADWKHRVILKDPTPVWTLVWAGPKVRDWGFWIKNKMCPWNAYKNGVCWCGEQPEQ